MSADNDIGPAGTGGLGDAGIGRRRGYRPGGAKSTTFGFDRPLGGLHFAGGYGGRLCRGDAGRSDRAAQIQADAAGGGLDLVRHRAGLPGTGPRRAGGRRVSRQSANLHRAVAVHHGIDDLSECDGRHAYIRCVESLAGHQAFELPAIVLDYRVFGVLPVLRRQRPDRRPTDGRGGGGGR